MCGKNAEKRIAQSVSQDPIDEADPLPIDNGDDFPETKLDVIAKAAEGDWEPFLHQYFRPCWREVTIACQMRGIPVSDAEDVFQQVMLQLLRQGSFRSEMRQWMAERGESPDFRANLAGRYLKYCELRLDGSRFRTYLKSVIRYQICETIRNASRQPKQLEDTQWKAIEPAVDESISRFLCQSWLQQCLERVCWELYFASKRSRTRGRQRLFDILCLSTVLGQSAEEIAQELGRDRTTVSALLTEARGRFGVYLGRVTGVTDPEELRSLLAKDPQQLTAALTRVYEMTHQEG